MRDRLSTQATEHGGALEIRSFQAGLGLTEERLGVALPAWQSPASPAGGDFAKNRWDFGDSRSLPVKDGDDESGTLTIRLAFP